MSQHVVLAEDSEGTRLTFAVVLTRAGYQVTQARNGREALDAIVANASAGTPVNLLITDIWMKELDGLQLLDELASRGIRLPILAMTGYGDNDLMIQLMKKGCKQYIEKPFGTEQLLATVREALGP